MFIYRVLGISRILRGDTANFLEVSSVCVRNDTVPKNEIGEASGVDVSRIEHPQH